MCVVHDVAYKRQKGLLVINGLPGFVDLLSQAVSFIRGHFFPFVKTGSIFIHAMLFIHVMIAIGFPCMLATESALLGPVHMVSGLCLSLFRFAGIGRVCAIAGTSRKCGVHSEKEQQDSQKK